MSRTEYDGEIGGGFDRERSIDSNGNRGDWSSGRDSDRDDDRGLSGFSRRLSPTHPAFNPAGERISDVGRSGWSEHESGNGYVSTVDRMNNHLSRYGTDSGYTRAFNENRNAISSAVVSTRQFLATAKDDQPKRSTALTGGAGLLAGEVKTRDQIKAFNDEISQFIKNNSFTNERDLKNKVEQKFGFGALDYHNLQDQIKDLRTTPFSDFQNAYRSSTLDTIENKPREIGGNYVGQNVAGAVSGAVAKGLSKAHPVAGIVGSGILSSIGGRAGSMYNESQRNNAMNGLNDTLKQAYAIGNFRGERELEQNKSKILSGLEAAASIGSFIPGAGAISSVVGLGANWANTEHSVSNALKNLSHDPVARSRYDARVARIENQRKQDREFEKVYGKRNDGNNTGILSAMANRVNHIPKQESKTLNMPYYSIPQIENLWDNLKIK